MLLLAASSRAFFTGHIPDAPLPGVVPFDARCNPVVATRNRNDFMNHLLPRRSRRTSFRAVAFSAAALVAVPFGALALGAGSAAAVPTMPTVSTLSTITEVARPSVYLQTPAGTWLQGGDVDASRDRLYLADSQKDDAPGLSVLNLDDETASTIPLGGGAYALDAAVSPVDGTVYVVHNTTQGYVSVVDPDSDYTSTSLPPLVAVGGNPQKVEVGEDGRAYVVNLTGDTVSVLGSADGDDRLNVVQTLSSVSTAGGTSAIDNERNRLFIASEYAKVVTVIDTAATPAAVIGTFSVQNTPTAITIDAATGDAVVVTQDDNAVSWFSTDDNWSTSTLDRSETLASDPNATLQLPLSASVRPDGTTLVVTQVFPSELQSFVSVIPADVTDDDPVRTIKVGNIAFWGVQDTQEGGSLYVPNGGNGNVSVISDITLTATASSATFGQDAQAQATLVRADGYPLTASIEFTDSDYASLGSVPVDASGTATLNLGKQAVGSVPFAAAAMIRDSVKLRVAGSATTSPAETTTTVTLDPAQVVEGGSTSATITVAGANGTLPTGTVTLKNGADVVGTATLDAGAATITLSSLVAGSSQLVASYVGDASHAASASAATTLTVTPRTATAAVNTPDTKVGGSVTVNLSGFAPNETVKLTLHSDPIELGTIKVDAAGSAAFTFTVPQVDPGKHTVVALGLSSGRTSSTEVTIGAVNPGNPGTPTVNPVTGVVTPAVPAPSNGLASTGVSESGPVVIGGLIALLLGFGLVAWRRHARRSTQS